MKSGLTARTRILTALEQEAIAAGALAKATSQSYKVVFHHLRLLEAEGAVKRRGKKPYSWTLTGLGQKRLLR